MSCKYKKLTNTDGKHPWCWVTGGECQFLKSPYDETCPILIGYPNVPMDAKEYNKVTISDKVIADILNLQIDEVK